MTRPFSTHSSAAPVPGTPLPPIYSSAVTFGGSTDGALSLHRGLRTQAALIVSRLPSEFNEPEWRRDWREFHEDWLARTGNGLKLDDAITYMRYPSHFLETEEEMRY